MANFQLQQFRKDPILGRSQDDIECGLDSSFLPRHTGFSLLFWTSVLPDYPIDWSSPSPLIQVLQLQKQSTTCTDPSPQEKQFSPNGENYNGLDPSV